ncbi:MAG: cytochrome c [Acidobacteria bacterium]|nr:cytochrome c [Acidobacteriota bacterium]
MLRGLLSILAASVISVVLTAQDKPKIQKVPPSRTDPTSGSEMFRAYCAPCHGLQGKGDGPAAPALNKRPANLTELAARNKGKFPALRVYNSILGDTLVVAHGSKDMPVWGDVFRSISHDEGDIKLRVNNLTKYIETLQKAPTN